MNIAIVGANLSGVYLSYLLAQQGSMVSLFDHKAPYEKPCGGGVSYKTFQEFSFLKNDNLLKKKIERVKLISPSGCSFDMPLKQPIHTYSRKDISNFLLQESIRLGVRFKPEKIVDIKKNGPTLSLVTATESHPFDFVVGADGARSLVRHKMRGMLPRHLYHITYGYFLPDFNINKIILKFHHQISGYIWIFQRLKGVSIGIGALVNELSASELKKVLNEFICQEYPGIDLTNATSYNAFIPCLSEEYYDNMKCAGDNWALIGDAAGFVDPISGEGIYFALKSAKLLADCLLQDKIANYDPDWMHAFGRDLMKASSLKKIVTDTEFNEIMLFLASKSKTLQSFFSENLAGQQNYLTLKKRLSAKTFSCFKELMFNTDWASKKMLIKKLKYIYSKF